MKVYISKLTLKPHCLDLYSSPLLTLHIAHMYTHKTYTHTLTHKHTHTHPHPPTHPHTVIVEKHNSPKWDPPTLAEVTPAMVARYFAPLTSQS